MVNAISHWAKRKYGVIFGFSNGNDKEILRRNLSFVEEKLIDNWNIKKRKTSRRSVRLSIARFIVVENKRRDKCLEHDERAYSRFTLWQ